MTMSALFPSRDLNRPTRDVPVPRSGVMFTADGTPPQPVGTRSWDPVRRMHLIRVLPGEAYVTARPDEIVVTVLGSCITACIRDPATGFGGINHFLLPASRKGTWSGTNSALRYGNHAMEILINEVLKTGCRRQDLEIKLFGGANLTEAGPQIGRSNVEFVLDYLATEGLAVTSSDLGGPYGRRIQYRPASGAVHRFLFGKSLNPDLAEEEKSFRQRLSRRRISGTAELF